MHLIEIRTHHKNGSESLRMIWNWEVKTYHSDAHPVADQQVTAKVA